MEMYFMNIDEACSPHEKLLSEGCLNRINGYPNKDKRQESLAAYVLLTYAIKDKFNDAVIPLDISWTEEGKPYLKTFKRIPGYPKPCCKKRCSKDKGIEEIECERPHDGERECRDKAKVFFSISHSDKFVVVCLSDKEIGVDIEKVTDVNPSLSRKLIHRNNKEAYEYSDDKSKILLENWCLKEAYYKCSGKIKPSSSTPIETYNIFKDIYVIDKHNYGFIKYFNEYCMALVTKDIVSIEKSESFMVDKSKIECLISSSIAH